MQTIGVRELKASLSACLRRVQSGERLTVTDRGRAIATSRPWPRRPRSNGCRRTWRVDEPNGAAASLPASTPRIKSRGKPASLMVLEDRR